MKRYLVFAGDRYYPAPAMGDLKNSFEDKDEGIELARKLAYKDWVLIYDLQEQKYVWWDSKNDPNDDNC